MGQRSSNRVVSIKGNKEAFILLSLDRILCVFLESSGFKLQLVAEVM